MTSFASLSTPVDLGGSRIFLTGGTGFVGRSLLDYLAESAASPGAPFEVVVLSRDPQEFLRRHPQYAGLGWLTFLAGDVRRLDGEATARAGRFTHVVHAAAESHSAQDPINWMRQIVDGTQQTLEFAVASGASRMLLASSGAVYGPQPLDLAHLPETWAGAPSPQHASSAYGQAKRLAEQLCTVYGARYGLEAVVARYFALVSQHVPLDGAFAIGNFIGDALRGGPIRVAGDGRAIRSYLYGRDMAHWSFTLLLRGLPGEAYNVGSDLALSIAEIARRVADGLAPGSEVLVKGDMRLGVERSVYVPDIAKAAALGLRVETGLDEAIRRSTMEQATWR